MDHNYLNSELWRPTQPPVEERRERKRGETNGFYLYFYTRFIQRWDTLDIFVY